MDAYARKLAATARFFGFLLVVVLAACSEEPGNAGGPADSLSAPGLADRADTTESQVHDGTTDGMNREAESDADRPADQGDTTYQVDRVIVPRPIPPGTTSGARARLLPVDEAGSDPTLVTYRMQVLEAVGRRDAERLNDFLSHDIHVDFGGGSGRALFREMWEPGRSDSEIWGLLGRVLGGGGLYEEGPFPLADGRSASARFTAPYYFAAFPGDRYDVFQHAVVLSADALVRDEPAPDGVVVDTLSYAIVRLPEPLMREGSPREWTRIALGGERFGYIRSDLIASPIGYRAVLHRVNGRWEMSAFVAGD